MSKNSENVIKWRSRTKKKMVQSMGGCCQICKYSACDEALDFHHIDPSQKDFSFGKLRASPRKLSIIIEELKKCILLCCRCHREVHLGLAVIPDSFSVLDETVLVSENELKNRVKQQSGIFLKKIPVDRRKIFLTKDQLHAMLLEVDGNKSRLAKYLNVSEAAIRKKLKLICSKEHPKNGAEVNDYSSSYTKGLI